MRIGIGYDIHRFVEDRKLILGGIHIPYEKGLLGHSDADVLIHSICDAILGALNLGDIGEHFPDTEIKYKDIDSSIILKHTLKLLKQNKYNIVNIDNIIICEKPKLKEYKEKIQDNLSKLLEINKNQINIKAKTNEKLDGIGKKEAVACQSVVLIKKVK